MASRWFLVVPLPIHSSMVTIAYLGFIFSLLWCVFSADTLRLFKNDQEVPVNNTGIAWPSDKQMKFKNPSVNNKNLSESKLVAYRFVCSIIPQLIFCHFPPPSPVYKDFAKPQNWRKNVWELDPDNPDNNGLQNEDLIVWMRTAALPTFRKLYRRLDRTKEGYTSGLLAGNYTLHVDYSKTNMSNWTNLKFQWFSFHLSDQIIQSSPLPARNGSSFQRLLFWEAKILSLASPT